MDKDMLVKNIKEWVKLDNEINTLNTEIKKRKNLKKELSTNLMDFMKNNEIDCFDINDGKIVYTSTKSKKPFTKKYLLETLNTLYGEQGIKIASDLIQNQDIVIKNNIKQKK
tara:strand:- start:214 stop:549 length:336 start_codon:yes stop_codon:yes gene_type:complete